MPRERCRCGDIDCDLFAIRQNYCRPCGEHHRGDECAINSEGQSLMDCGCPWSESELLGGTGCKHDKEVSDGSEERGWRDTLVGRVWGPQIDFQMDGVSFNTGQFSGDRVSHARASDLLDSFHYTYGSFGSTAGTTTSAQNIIIVGGSPPIEQ